MSAALQAQQRVRRLPPEVNRRGGALGGGLEGRGGLRVLPRPARTPSSARRSLQAPAARPLGPHAASPLPPRRILYVRNLPFNISAEEVRRASLGALASPPPPPLPLAEQPPPRRLLLSSTPLLQPPARPLQLYSLFGKYGAIRQIRVGNSKETRGTAYVVYEVRGDEWG